MPGSREKDRAMLARPVSQWLLLILVLAVLFLSSLAFSKPISQGGRTPTPEPTCTGNLAEGTAAAMTQTPSAEETEEDPPTPEEIGYTDGIIFCSTVLVLILLVGTLRETLRRRGR